MSKVRITSEKNWADAKITVGDEVIEGVRAVSVTIEVGKPNTAIIELLDVQVDTSLEDRDLERIEITETHKRVVKHHE